MEAKSSQNEYEQVRQDLQQLREDLSKLTKAVADGQKSNISSLRDEIRRESREAFDQVRQHGMKPSTAPVMQVLRRCTMLSTKSRNGRS